MKLREAHGIIHKWRGIKFIKEIQKEMGDPTIPHDQILFLSVFAEKMVHATEAYFCLVHLLIRTLANQVRPMITARNPHIFLRGFPRSSAAQGLR